MGDEGKESAEGAILVDIFVKYTGRSIYPMLDGEINNAVLPNTRCW